MKYILLPDIGFFSISNCTTHSEGTNFEYKEVTAKSYECLLGQKYLEKFVINMGTTESIDNVQFYSFTNKSKSLLHLVLEKCPDWKIGHIDHILTTMQRSFEVSRQDVYSFLMNDIATAFKCVFIFNTLNNTINAYAESNFGKDTDIHISYNNLLKNTDIVCDVSDIKTCLTITGADDLSIRDINMGYDRIYNFDYYNSTEFMSQDLFRSYNRWLKTIDYYSSQYTTLISELKECNSSINYWTNEKMPNNLESTDWSEYGLNPLKEKLTSYEQIQATHMKAGWGEKSSEYYESDYLPNYQTIIEIKNQIKHVNKTINDYVASRDKINNEISIIIRKTSMEYNFSEDELKELSTFIREDELNSDNFVVTDSMSEDERYEMLDELLKFGNEELCKVSTPSLAFSADISNIFQIPEFEKLYSNFDVGNYIWVTLRDDYHIKAKLLHLHLNFYDVTDFSVGFGNIAKKEKNRYTDISEAIKSASSVATSVSFNSSHWTQASKDATNINKMLDEGLLAAGKYLTNGDDSEMIIDKRGIFVNTTSGEYANLDSIFMGGGRILYTDDNWESVTMSVGRAVINGESRFGTFADFCIASYIAGSTIVGGKLYSDNYEEGSVGTYFDLENGDFQLAGGKIMYNASDNKMEMKDVTVQWKGDNSVNAPEIDDIKDLSSTITSLNKDIEDAQTSATNSYNRANEAYTHADDLKRASDEYAESKMSELDEKVAGYLTAGGKTSIGDDYILSPYIGGGYLNITNNNKKVIIDPNNYTETGYIFQVHNGSEISVGINSNGDAIFNGDIIAKSLTLGTGVSISSNKVSGLSKVATSGKYSDLSGKPTIPTAITDLTGSANILYSDNVSISSTTTSDGITTQTITVGDKKYTSITNGDFVLTDVGLGTDTSDGSKSYTCISTEGLLTAKNAIIYGTIYATNGKFSGEVIAEKGELGGWIINESGIRSDHDDKGFRVSLYCPTEMGGSGNGNADVLVVRTGTSSENYDYPLVLSSDGSLKATKATIEGKITSKEGYIGGWKIIEGYLYNSITTDKANSCGMSSGTAQGGDDNRIFWAGKDNFKVDISGKVTATNIVATGGSIGGWAISSSQLKKEDTTNGFMVRFHCPTELGSPGNGNADVLVVRNGKGTDSSPYSYPFGITSDGTLTATKANITGSVTATSGNIGGCSISGGVLQVASANITGTLSGKTITGGTISGTTITSNSATITGGSFKVTGLSVDDVKMSVGYNGYKILIAPYAIYSENSNSSNYTAMRHDGFYVHDTTTSGQAFSYLSSSGYGTSGTKSRIATTENYNQRLLYCYETPTPTFGDIGEGTIDETGKCYVFLDDVFAETIDTNCKYQVFLQAYGKGECYVTERTSSYFIVEGTANLSFGWEIKSVQLGYDTMRLEEFSKESVTNTETDIAEETYSYLNSLLFTVDDQTYPNENESEEKE